MASTEDKNLSREALILLLRILADYVEGVALGDADKIRAAGFDVVTHQHVPQTPLATPAILAVINGLTTQLKLRVSSVPHAAAYEVQYRIAGGAWQSGGVFQNTLDIILTGLVPGTTYEIRARAIGGSTGSSNWSESVNHMAT